MGEVGWYEVGWGGLGARGGGGLEKKGHRGVSERSVALAALKRLKHL